MSTPQGDAKSPTVTVTELGSQTLAEGLHAVFTALGGIQEVLPAGRRVVIKPNAVSFTPHTYTATDLLDALLGYLGEMGHRRVAVAENVTGGNFTRLVFDAIGYRRVCRRHGAEPVYLDEGPQVEVTLPGEDAPIRVSRWLRDRLITAREDHTYLSLPTLKTHSMTKVTMGIKNQQAFPSHADRMHPHSRDTLHRRLASLFAWIQPDLTLIDGRRAVIHGHFPPKALSEECLVELGVLVGGADPLAVDVVGARLLGYEVDEVEHLRLCAEQGLGQGDLERIRVVGADLARFDTKQPHTLLGRFHPDVRILEGGERACDEGCKGNSLCIQEMLTNDYDGRGGWTLAFGRGLDPEALRNSPGDLLVIGPCACRTATEAFAQRPRHGRVYSVPVCNDLMQNVRFQARLMGVKPVSMSPIHPLRAAWHLLVAKLRGTTARVPPLFG